MAKKWTHLPDGGIVVNPAFWDTSRISFMYKKAVLESLVSIYDDLKLKDLVDCVIMRIKELESQQQPEE